MIKELQKEIHQNAKDKGFWEHNIIDTSTGIDADTKIININNLIISQKLMLIVSELGEALESLRNNKRSNQDLLKYANGKPPECFEKDYKDTFEDELADSIIRILDLAEWLGIDLETHIKLKMEYNKTRPSKHNKEF